MSRCTPCRRAQGKGLGRCFEGVPRAERRNRLMLENINAGRRHPPCLRKGCPAPLFAREGGSVTERHLLFALRGAGGGARPGKGLIGFLEKELGLALSGKNREWLSDTGAPGYLYDLLGALKGGLVRKYTSMRATNAPTCRSCSSLRTGSARWRPTPIWATLLLVTGDRRAAV